jgi:G:T-mismatch repair DNA endonuclease (very short patch repair protein)
MRRNAARDKLTNRALRKAGWRVLIIWECQIVPAKLDRLRARIVAFLDAKSPNAPRKK